MAWYFISYIRMVRFSIFSLLLAITTYEICCLQSRISTWQHQFVCKDTKTLLGTEAITSDTLAGCCILCVALKGPDYLYLYYDSETQYCHCNPELRDDYDDDSASEVIYCILRTSAKTDLMPGMDTELSVWSIPTDCLSLYETNSSTQDGVYAIWPKGGLLTEAWCEITNGGWTVIQRRMDGSENFDRGWFDYVHGFGDRTGEHWLGLENMHRLTDNGSELIVHLEGFTDKAVTIRFANFMIGDGSSNYVLNVSGSTVSCGNDFVTKHSGTPFSTFDNDNDGTGVNCAKWLHGGWWFHYCYDVYCNGLYRHNTYRGIQMTECFGEAAVKRVVMKFITCLTLRE